MKRRMKTTHPFQDDERSKKIIPPSGRFVLVFHTLITANFRPRLFSGIMAERRRRRARARGTSTVYEADAPLFII